MYGTIISGFKKAAGILWALAGDFCTGEENFYTEDITNVFIVVDFMQLAQCYIIIMVNWEKDTAYYDSFKVHELII